MRENLQIVFIFLCFVVFANEAETTNGVWIDGNSFYTHIVHEKKSTLYFENWTVYSKQFLSDDNYYVALQLDTNFDPLPEDKKSLPSLKDLSAIADKEVRANYLRFLENFGRTYGISYMVLPDIIGLSPYEKEVITQASSSSPYYFLQKSYLTHILPESKKEFLEDTEMHPTIWIINQDEDTKKLDRWNRKIADTKTHFFYSELRKSKRIEFTPTFKLPVFLAKMVFAESTITIDASNTFPVREKTITYLGKDRQLRKRLGQYANVLDYRKNGIKCVVDLRFEEQDYLKGDILLCKALKEESNSSLIFSNIDFAEQNILIGEMLFGAQGIKGRSNLPNAKQVNNSFYLGFSEPHVEEMNPGHLSKGDLLAYEAIKKYATPGIQVAVVKNGSLVMEKSYGFFTYDSIIPVSHQTIYDIASLTKVMATLPAVALLIDQGKLALDDPLGQHLKEFSESNKGKATIRQLLAHNAGLLPYVPFWNMIIDEDRLAHFYYKTAQDKANDIRTYGLEIHPNMIDSLKNFIAKSELIENPNEYTYSDIGFMILHLVVEEVSGIPFDTFVEDNFYKPMGLVNTLFNPKQKGRSYGEIAPTEFDSRYRNYPVWGEVHDKNALVFGGVAGHAGLFSTASDLAKMMFMFLNNGYYGGKQYLSKETLDQFNFRHFNGNRRGLGWDKKDKKLNIASSLASDRSFGHTGFTGTMIWADPEQDLIFVFLSNRIYPDTNNWKLSELHTRIYFHDVIYQSLENRN